MVAVKTCHFRDPVPVRQRMCIPVIRSCSGFSPVIGHLGLNPLRDMPRIIAIVASTIWSSSASILIGGTGATACLAQLIFAVQGLFC